MWRIAIVVVSLALTFSQSASASPAAQSVQTPTAATLIVPAGTTVDLALSGAIWSRTAKPGDSVYAQTTFPVAAGMLVAIPAGTYVEGVIDTLTRPGFFSPHAQFQIHFTKLIFVNGYTVILAGPQNITTASGASATSDILAAVSTPHVVVSAASDVLLDNGSQIEMVLQLPVALDRDSVAAAARESPTYQPPSSRSATVCVPVPATPGTPDTVIPGIPGTPGTPPTVIPGAPGTPDTVIPGTPGTPGTPPTVIPGTSGTPGVSCPGPPLVVSPKPEEVTSSFPIGAPVQVSGKTLSPGRYEVRWSRGGTNTQVEIIQNKTAITTVKARVVLLDRESPADSVTTRTNTDGSLSLDSIRFEGQSVALYFD
jgi:hypothetical protein